MNTDFKPVAVPPVFAHLEEIPVQPAFLVRDSDPRRAVERHRARMAEQGIELPPPPKKKAALNGRAAIALAFDQQEAILDALDGSYAGKHWSDKWGAMYKRWAMSDIFETILADGEADPRRVRRVLGPVLLELNPRADELGRALLMIFRAWQLRQQVVIERRAMSLIPVVGGMALGSTPSFTPVLKRISSYRYGAKTRWRVGWPGDGMEPGLIEGDAVRPALQDAMAMFNRRYFKEQQDFFEVKQDMVTRALPDPEHIYFVPWGRKLKTDRQLPVGGEAILEEISHGRVFRLKLSDGRQFILRSTPPGAVRKVVAALSNGNPTYPPPPTSTEIEKSYLDEMAGRKVEAQIMGVLPSPVFLKPFAFLMADAVYVVNMEGRAERQEISVAWTKANAHNVLAVISGTKHPTRAVLLCNPQRDRLAIVPVSYRTRKPDVKALWTATPVADLSPTRQSDRTALTGWAAWAWYKKAGKYLP